MEIERENIMQESGQFPVNRRLQKIRVPDDGLTMESLAPRLQEADTSYDGSASSAVVASSLEDSVTLMASSWLEHKFSRFLWVSLLVAPLLVSYYTRNIMGVSLTLSVIAGLCTHSIVPEVGRLLLTAEMSGRDLNKPKQPKLAESLGVAAGSVYLIAMFLFIPFPFLNWMQIRTTSTLETLGNYTAALLSISSMLFLGFADDVMNLKWRQKVLLPAMASLPLLMIYRLTNARTEVVVPLLLRSLFFDRVTVDIGLAYYGYMAALAIFCTHSINILAGVNGVEVGQSVVIGVFVVINNLLMIWNGDSRASLHYFSIFLILPFLGAALALLHHNWYPARVFVGDTFCYFAGMTFAVAGILGHFSKTLLLLFVPQIFNFCLSIPQLFGLVPCPRHRLPRLNAATGCLEASTFVIVDFEKLSFAGQLSLKLLSVLRLVRFVRAPSTETSQSAVCTNLTFLCVLLNWFGPMREDRLAALVVAVQAGSCAAGLLIRHFFSQFLFQ